MLQLLQLLQLSSDNVSDSNISLEKYKEFSTLRYHEDEVEQ